MYAVTGSTYLASLVMLFFLLPAPLAVFALLVLSLGFLLQLGSMVSFARSRFSFIEIDVHQRWYLVSIKSKDADNTNHLAPVVMKSWHVIGSVVFLRLSHQKRSHCIAVFATDQQGSQFHRLRVYLRNHAHTSA